LFYSFKPITASIVKGSDTGTWLFFVYNIKHLLSDDTIFKYRMLMTLIYWCVKTLL